MIVREAVVCVRGGGVGLRSPSRFWLRITYCPVLLELRLGVRVWERAVVPRVVSEEPVPEHGRL